MQNCPEIIAIQHKEDGNYCLQHGLIDEAIMHYTKSLVSIHSNFLNELIFGCWQNLSPDNYIVFTNRATAFKKHQEFELMMEDSKNAIELNQDYFKAHLRHGEACIELGKRPKYIDLELIDSGIQSLQKALNLCWKMVPSDQKYMQKSSFEKQISKQILKAKKIRWYKK